MYMNILCRKFSKNPTKLFSPHIVTGINIKKIIRRKTKSRQIEKRSRGNYAQTHGQ